MEPTVNAHDRAVIVSALRKSRSAVSHAMALSVANWPKYSDQYFADPIGFAELEMVSLVDYLIGFAETDDSIYLDLYIGEKARQFYNHENQATESPELIEYVLSAERCAVLSAINQEGNTAQTVVEQLFAYFQEILIQNRNLTQLKVLFVGDCLYTDVVSFLAAGLFREGVQLISTFIVSKDPKEVRRQLAAQRNVEFDVVFYSPYTYAFNIHYANMQSLRSILVKPWQIFKLTLKSIDGTLITIDTLADLFSNLIFVHDVGPISRYERTPVQLLRRTILWAPHRYIARKLSAQISSHIRTLEKIGHTNLHLLEERSMMSRTGPREASQYIFRSHVQHPARFGALVASRYQDILYVQSHLQSRKVIVCDLDETLWKGAIGEGFGVSPYRDRQETLLRLKERGILLTIASKNDERLVTWEDCALKPADFVCSQIHWRPKVESIHDIALHLNLKEAHFIVIDDRIDERLLAESQYPGLLALDALDPRTWVHLDLWATMMSTNQNSDRTDLYRQRDERAAFLLEEEAVDSSRSLDLFRLLELRAQVREASSRDLDRVLELVNRTNQFNTTAKRITKQSLTDAHADPDTRVLVADVSDRFGAMGIVSAAIARWDPDRTATSIDVFVLSCRVFGYDIESLMLRGIASLGPTGHSVLGKIVPSEYNQPCQDVYVRHGFGRAGEAFHLMCDDSHRIPVPSWIEAEFSIAPFVKSR